MKQLFFLSVVLLLANACGRDRTDTDPAAAPAVRVELRVRPDCTAVATRAADEAAVHDVNLWLCDRTGKIVVHEYRDTPTFSFTCRPGTYRLRVAANLGRDFEAETDTDNLTLTHRDDCDVLPMICEEEVTISAHTGGSLRLPDVEVRRIAAKVTCRIAIADPDIEVRSLRLMSIPRVVRLFGAEDAPSAVAADYMNGSERPAAGMNAESVFYSFPNMQGTVPSIADQRQKNRDNAPDNASYLLIRAVKGDRILAYTVYLGGNNTSDFNVRANTHYRLDISILGDNEVDTRIAAYTVNAEDDFEVYALGGYCTFRPSNRLRVRVASENADPELTGRIELLEGDEAGFSFDRAAGPTHTFAVDNNNGNNNYRMAYSPALFTSDNHRLHYRLTLTDAYGFSQAYDFEHRFADLLTVYCDRAGGGITADGALHIRFSDEESMRRTDVLTLQEGCRLIAEAETGYFFAGWYADARYTECIARTRILDYRPQELRNALYARFVACGTPLDTNGTANCYIARSLNSAYSFDATTMGNGRATTGIVPSALAGTHAQVLWETGDVRGAVVKDALYADGRIHIQTGSTYGDAVVGLFDDDGTCLWSWHIWVVDYAPEATAQTYASGAVFMDRNLGALSTDPYDNAVKGLHYQWGRKDPFPWTSMPLDHTPEYIACSYLTGYEHAVYSPKYKDDPEAASTVAWSIAHPTTYMGAAVIPAGSGVHLYDPWCYPPNPNLWGNASDGTSVSSRNAKSIYDPCPPGWKVPASEAWDMNTFRYASNYEECGYDVYYSSAATSAFYPFGGYLHDNSGQEVFVQPYLWGGVWTCTASNRRGGSTFESAAGKCVILIQGTANPDYRAESQTLGYAVRCAKE